MFNRRQQYNNTEHIFLSFFNIFPFSRAVKSHFFTHHLAPHINLLRKMRKYLHHQKGLPELNPQIRKSRAARLRCGRYEEEYVSPPGQR